MYYYEYRDKMFQFITKYHKAKNGYSVAVSVFLIKDLPGLWKGHTIVFGGIYLRDR